MKEIFDTVNDYILLLDAIALSMFFVLAIRNRQPYSSFITLAITTLMSFFIIEYIALVEVMNGPYVEGRLLISWGVSFFILDVLAAYFFLHCYRASIAKKRVELRVFYSAFSVAALTSFIVVQYGPLFWAIEGISNEQWVRMAYYLGTALLDGLVIYVIYQSHRVIRKQYSVISKMYLLAFFIAALLQISRFFQSYPSGPDY
jgi:hypothetical protein